MYKYAMNPFNLSAAHKMAFSLGSKTAQGPGRDATCIEKLIGYAVSRHEVGEQLIFLPVFSMYKGAP